MKLKCIRANQSSFHTINFKEGLNIIFGTFRNFLNTLIVRLRILKTLKNLESVMIKLFYAKVYVTNRRKNT